LIGLRSRRAATVLAIVIAIVLVISSVAPAQSAITYGRWRDINPTQYTGDPAGTLRGVYVRSGGSGAIGAGDGWAVGGDSTFGPVLTHYDGFSWPIIASPIGGTSTEYNSVNFCTSPGAPSVGLCSPNGDGSDGWIVGTDGTNGVALYWDGFTLTTINTGLSVTAATNLTSVFMACHSPQFGSGCPGSIAAGLTIAVGANSTAGGTGDIWQFQGNPKNSPGWTHPEAWCNPAPCAVGSTTTKYNGVYLFQDSTGNLEGFAVGNGGVIAQLLSGVWTQARPNPAVTQDLLGVVVDQANPIDAWAVGRGGRILHYVPGTANGGWNTVPSPVSTDLVSIQLVSNSEGWIVGADGVILHSNTLGTSNIWGTAFSPLFSGVGPGTDLLGVSFSSSGNGWAVGSQGVILQTSNSGCGSIVQQQGTLVCWGGSTSTLLSSQLNAVYELSSSDAWAAGLSDGSGYPLIHWDGIKWHRASVSAASGVDIWSIFMVGSSEGWAMGGIGLNQPEALLWNGQSWSPQTIAACSFGLVGCQPRSAYMISGGQTGDGWAVGLGGQIWRYQGGTWGAVFRPTTNNLNSVFINNPGATDPQPAGWAVGNGGTVLALTISGGAPIWTLRGIPGVSSQNLNAVYFKDSDHGWIVGASSTILQTTDGGNTWSGGIGQVTGAPAGTNLTSVFVDQFGTGAGNGDGWAVGDDGTGTENAIFAHWDGVSWVNTPLAPPILAGNPAPGMSLRSVFLTGPEDGWAVGRPVAGGSLSGIIHLDPPNPPTVYTATTTSPTTGSTSITSVATSSTVSSTSSSVTSTSSSEAVTTASTATTEISTSISTSLVSTTAVVTQTVTTSSSTTTPLVLPAIPGFPWESIIAGVVIGIALLGITRRNKRKTL